jgi:hypothetical protein
VRPSSEGYEQKRGGRIMRIDRRYAYEEHFLDLRSGRISFGQFAKRTARLWRTLAAQIRRRWQHPPWHGFEDTVNDLLLWAWVFVPEFDPSRGQSMQRYVVWNAYDKTKKECHRIRGASHSRPAGASDNPDRARSRLERPLSSYGEEGSDDGEVSGAVERICFAHGVYTAAMQEADLLHEEERGQVAARVWAYADNPSEMVALEVLAEARSIGEAAAMLYAREEARSELGLESEGHAAEVVTRVVRAVSARMGTAA